jgi:hypothetical protein
VRNHFSVDLSAVVVAVTADEPKVLAIRADDSGSASSAALRDALPDALPSGRLESQHRTLEAGLRSWVERQTGQSLGYVEQLYTFGDSNRIISGAMEQRVLSIGYLALVREARVSHLGGLVGEAVWRDWYRYFPWEDWRNGKPAILIPIEQQLKRWGAAAATKDERRLREERLRIAFGQRDIAWSDERVLERYELLYEVGLVPEAHRDMGEIHRGRSGRDEGGQPWAAAEDAITEGAIMLGDHRRVLATAIARLRGKIKYRPVVFELMPPAFRFLQLQRAVEALAGLRLHKSNFRRLVESQGLVEETGEVEAGTGGRPARLLRFRREVLLDRPAPGLRLPVARGERA